WNCALVGAGYALGDRWEEVGDWVGYLQYVVIAVCVAAVAWFVWTRFVSPRRRREPEPPPKHRATVPSGTVPGSPVPDGSVPSGPVSGGSVSSGAVPSATAPDERR